MNSLHKHPQPWLNFSIRTFSLRREEIVKFLKDDLLISQNKNWAFF